MIKTNFYNLWYDNANLNPVVIGIFSENSEVNNSIFQNITRVTPKSK